MIVYCIFVFSFQYDNVKDYYHDFKRDVGSEPYEEGGDEYYNYLLDTGSAETISFLITYI